MMKRLLIAMYIDYLDNFLHVLQRPDRAVLAMAIDYGLTAQETEAMLDLGRKLHNHDFTE